MRRGFAELAQLARAPLGANIARAQYRDQQGRLGQLCDDLGVEDVVAAKLLIAPDARPLAQALAEHGLQRGMELGHPALLLGRERLVVEVRVADEGVVLEIHCGGGRGQARELR